MKPARLRPLAKADLSDQAAYYAEQAGLDTAERFVDAALRALAEAERQPGIGSPRWHRGDGPVLRGWRVGNFPMIWFYVERAEHLDVIRLLGERQDIGALLQADAG